MRTIRREIREFRDFLYDSSVNIKDRCFLVFSLAMIVSFLVSVPCGFIMKEPLSSTLNTLFASALFTVFVVIAYRSKKIRRIRLLVAFLDVFVLMPGLFLTNGGVFSGAPLWVD